MKPAEAFAMIQILKCAEPNETTIPAYEKAMQTNFNFGHDEDECEDDNCDCHLNISVGGLVTWQDCSSNYLEQCVPGTIFRGIDKVTGMRQLYVILAKAPAMIWIPISDESELMGAVAKYHFDTQEWEPVAVEPLAEIPNVMEDHATLGSFYRITDLLGTPIGILGDDEETVDNLTGIYRAVPDEIEGGIKFYSANFMLENLTAFGVMPDEWRELLKHELGEDIFEEEEEPTVPTEVTAMKQTAEAEVDQGEYTFSKIQPLDPATMKPVGEPIVIQDEAGDPDPSKEPERDAETDSILAAVDKELE